MKRASGEPAARAAERLIRVSGGPLGPVVEVSYDNGRTYGIGYLGEDGMPMSPGATVAPMATTEEKLIDEAVSLLSPLAGAALEAVVDVVRLLVTHKDGAELAAKRNAQALAAEAFIRS